MTTKTCELWRKMQREHEEAWQEVCAMAALEFTPGMRVSWTHTFNRDGTPVKRVGIVQSVFVGSLTVRMKEDGPNHRVAAHLAEIV